ncbi:hypothetical protein Syun_003144 [Stephania yunnanensis]|uniref:Uncharacterized protein n=1 Tax=Stephania yunnanensis TaxID=152371 RepID=A0AAP0L2C3_9MAGN
MAKLSTDSPLSRRIVLAFLDFLESVEPSPGTDLEGLDVAKECLEDVFKLNQSSIEDRVDPGLLIEFFSFLNEKDQHEHPDHLAGSTDVPGTSTTPRNDRNASASQTSLFHHFNYAIDGSSFYNFLTPKSGRTLYFLHTIDFVHCIYLNMLTPYISTFLLFSLASYLWRTGSPLEFLPSFLSSMLFRDLKELWDIGIILSCSNSFLQCNQSSAYTQIQMCAEAISDSLKSIDIDPGYSKAYSRLGLAYYAQGNYHDAINEGFMKALQLDPSSDSIKENIQVAQQKIMEAQREADQNARSTSQNNQEANGQSSGRSANRNAPPSFTSFPFNSSTLPNDFANIFMNMASNAYQGHHPNDSSQNGTDSGRPNEPEIRIGGNINLNLEDMPEELMGTWRSVMGMFSGPQPHQNSGGDGDRGSTPN